MSTHNRDASKPAVAATGYAQTLERSLGAFSMFTLQYSYLSVLSGTSILFALGYGLGGPAGIWAWTAVFAGQMLLALLFMELSAHWPIAGAVYNWCKHLRSPAAAWMGGWMIIFTAVTSLAAVALAGQIVLPTIWSGFQIIGSGTTATSYSENAVLLGGVIVVVVTFVNCLRVQLIGFVNNVTVVAEIVIGFALIILLFVHAKHSPSVVGNTLGTGRGYSSGYLGAFVVATFFGAFEFFGFDTAGSLAEESRDPHRQAPQSILRAMAATFVIGFLLILATEMAIPHLADPKVATGGLAYVVVTALGTTLGRLLLIGVFLAIFGNAIAIQAAGTRMIFGMARDGKLPFSSRLSRVSGTSGAIIVPTLITGAIAIALLLVNVKSSQIVAVLTSVATLTCATAYLFVSTPLLFARLRGTFPPHDTFNRRQEYFSLGRAGVVVNLLAVIWGVALVINLMWPRQAIYNAVPPYHWYLRFGPMLIIGVMVGVGAIYYSSCARHRTEVVGEHQADAPAEAPAEVLVVGGGAA